MSPFAMENIVGAMCRVFPALVLGCFEGAPVHQQLILLILISPILEAADVQVFPRNVVFVLPFMWDVNIRSNFGFVWHLRGK